MKCITKLKDNHLSESLEDYLEAIYWIEREKKVARSKDIASRLHVSTSSVTGALHTLSDLGLVNYSPYHLVTLTQKGRKEARGVVRRHETLREFFTCVLCIDRKEADETACRMEHVLSAEILDRLVQFIEFVKQSRNDDMEWIHRLPYNCPARSEEDRGQ
jgi:DtxR family Mn-dependent transcriptional regulator